MFNFICLQIGLGVYLPNGTDKFVSSPIQFSDLG